MKNRKTKMKILLLGVAVAAMLLMPVKARAQDSFQNQSFGSSSGGFSNQGFGTSGGGSFGNQSFGSSGGGSFGNQSFGAVDNSNGNFNNQTFGNQPDAPLGSGLLIMAVACAGYALLKKKNQQLN